MYRESRNEEERAAQKAYHLAWRIRNREKLNAKARARYPAHKEAQKTATYKWREKFPDRYMNSVLKTVYGITLDQYNAKLQEQNGVCAGCLEPCDSGLRLSVDHCHETGQFRGLLCKKCNTVLEFVKENPETLKRISDYAARWSLIKRAAS